MMRGYMYLVGGCLSFCDFFRWLVRGLTKTRYEFEHRDDTPSIAIILWLIASNEMRT